MLMVSYNIEGDVKMYYVLKRLDGVIEFRDHEVDGSVLISQDEYNQAANCKFPDRFDLIDGKIILINN